MLDGYGIVGESEDTVKLAKCKGKTRLFGSSSEILVLDLEVSDGQNVVLDNTLHGPRPVVYLKLGPVFLECG